MIPDDLKKVFKDKKVAILGFGREGTSTYHLIRSLFPEKHIAVFDSNDKIKEIPFLKDDLNCSIFSGRDYLNFLNDYDLVIKSPGISFKELSKIKLQGRITSQTDIFLSCFSSQVIGITGTKGKSTTSTLLLNVLKNAGYDVVFVGNIGIPPFDEVNHINENTFIVYEISSHQLQSVRNSPHISVLLNIFQEHLDHYNSYDDYQKAKMNILKFQKPDDIFIYNADNDVVLSKMKTLKVNSICLPFSNERDLKPGCYNDGKILKICLKNDICFLYDVNFKRNLLGHHNLMNIAIVIMVSKIIGVEDEVIFDTIATFIGLPHRMEYVGCFNNKHFYNDSIATIPEAAIEAIKTIKDVDTLVTGGFDRGIDYMAYANFLSHSSIRNIVFIGDAGKRMFDLMAGINNTKRCFLYDNFDDGVKKAIDLTKVASVCLMSPAAASYGMFKNFEERGMRFLEIIKQNS